MEGGAESVEPPSPSDTLEKEKWMADWLDELCPYYMSVGVSIEDFWHGDYTQLKYYARAHEIQVEQRNQELWLQGAYIYDAVGAVVASALSKKGAKATKYMEKPIRITPLSEAEKRVEAERERQKIIAALTAWEKAWNSKRKGDGIK